MPPALQAKLLRFLQDREFERVGETRTRSADVRIVAATNRDLEADVRAGRFREDLLYRLNVVELTLPPLRERPEDILPLARGFLAFFARSAKRPPLELSPAAEAALQRYAWPGNVRELRNAIERAAILWPAQRGRARGAARAHARRSRPSARGWAATSRSRRSSASTSERVVARAQSQEEAARILGIDPSTLWRKRKRYEES